MKPPYRFQALRIVPEGEILSELLDLHRLIFETQLKPEAFKERLKTMPDRLIQLAYTTKKPSLLVAYKIGYALKPMLYYSWMGGVHPEYRKQGLARELMLKQHQYCAEQGYHRIRTHCVNHLKAMIILNLQQGFDLIGTLHEPDRAMKLIMEKVLE